LAYADDIIIIGRTKQEMIDMFTKVKNEASKYGLLINKNKMKNMKCTRKQVRGNKLETDTMSFESVLTLKYLGSVVNQSNTIEEKIKERLIAEDKDFYSSKKNTSKQIIVKEIQIKTVLDINQAHCNVC
jgi:hypothetical protein